jgi:hypothetical protein
MKRPPVKLVLTNKELFEAAFAQLVLEGRLPGWIRNEELVVEVENVGDSTRFTIANKVEPS